MKKELYVDKNYIISPEGDRIQAMLLAPKYPRVLENRGVEKISLLSRIMQWLFC